MEIRGCEASMVEFMKLIPDKINVISQFIAIYFVLLALSKVWWLDLFCYFKIVMLILTRIKATVQDATKKLNTTGFKSVDE